ncbi:MAG: DUF4062 domain-containing protein [Bacillaceae bacterium]|nr:DUF4062 domain-containing protein [Bacillaceae bacterium]
MAKPRIFISSTFYDLKYTREELARFIKDLGYEPVLFERGQVPYGRQESPEDYCYKEIQLCDIVVSIVGGRYGTESKDNGNSITQKELRQAYSMGKQIYIFVEKNVKAEYETYKLNKNSENINYRYVDDKRVYEFIDELEKLPKNNSIFEFNSPQEIIHILREQFAGLFHRLLQEESERPQFEMVQSLKNIVNTLQQIVSLESKHHENQQDAIKDIMFINHPALYKMKNLLGIKHRILFSNIEELKDFLYDYNFEMKDDDPFSDYYEFSREDNDPFTVEEQLLKVSKELFDDSGKLKPQDRWEDTDILLERKEATLNITEDELPF